MFLVFGNDLVLRFHLKILYIAIEFVYFLLFTTLCSVPEIFDILKHYHQTLHVNTDQISKYLKVFQICFTLLISMVLEDYLITYSELYAKQVRRIFRKLIEANTGLNKVVSKCAIQ